MTSPITTKRPIDSTPRRLSGKARPTSSSMRRCTGGTRSSPARGIRPKRGARKTPFSKPKSPASAKKTPFSSRRLQQRNPTLAAEQAAHDETFKEKQSLQRFRVVAASLIDALLAGRANRPEFAELLNLTKAAADAIERGDRTVFRDEPEKSRVCDLAESPQKP